jgi:hypothetical protein
MLNSSPKNFSELGNFSHHTTKTPPSEEKNLCSKDQTLDSCRNSFAFTTRINHKVRLPLWKH